ncbi:MULTISPECIES: lytic transglycosylase domain-containing protein [Mesonia]|uniref:Membrane-bound lytic murein transglycosylase D n=1 Tax=Mesonia oceanica TaxID=2687242 RepID=A0AC61Y2U8_9FLAO|nr:MULTISPECIES: lytic transglycosylase domain-containing protein [Mesonia]VVU98796.1 Membrane-bound lytic murein transglycosylase D [Mesonia oceanica]|tara:strand:+ start:51692 stop:53308 length:1617 start_codon:yes stop_codon:yes gene_type:complete
MKIKNVVLGMVFCSGLGFSQTPTQKVDSIEIQKTQEEIDYTQKAVQTSGFDKVIEAQFTAFSPSSTLVNEEVLFGLRDYHQPALIDSIWQNTLLDSQLYAEMQETIKNTPYNDTVHKSIPTDTLKARLAKLNAKTPFNVTYNESLESVIQYYLRRDKEVMERLMSLSYYYFPMFEEKLDKYDIPLEIKYLAIVESALNPRAKSRVGATGLWQFMFATGKMHGLDVSSYVDERMDPVLATEAACKYLSNLYDSFGDWDLVLASYNSGPGNVSKAIRRSGGKTDYWELRRHLPRETAGYVPAFLATMYLFEYAKEHGYQPYQPEITYFETDTIKVKQLIKFDQITRVTNIDEELLEFLNPSYKLNIIPFIKDEEYYIRLPLVETGIFVANENLIYNYAEEAILANKQVLPKYYEADDKIRYRVRPGDYLGKIAERYGVGVSKIRGWNHLRSNNIRVGQYLTIYPRKPVASNPVQIQKPKGSDKKQEARKSSEQYYTVRQGDSLWSISRKFPGVTVQNIQKWNDIRGNKLKPGMKLKVSNG